MVLVTVKVLVVDKGLKVKGLQEIGCFYVIMVR